jgi:ribonuclease HI
VAKPVLAELLRFIAANEDLPRALARYKGYNRDILGKLIDAAADRIEQAEEAATAATAAAGSKGIKVRKVSEVERAARESAEDLDAAMNESKVDRDRKKKERVVAAAVEREAERVVAAHPGPAGAGAVIVSAEGHIVAKVGKYLGETTNNVAEYTGLILGLKRAKAMGLRELDVLADSELVVKQLNGEYAVKADHLKPLYDEAKLLLKGFDQIEVRYIPREENEAADEMSNRAIDLRL